MTVEVERIEAISRAVAGRHGCDLVDVSFRREANGWVLRALIDRPNGVGVEVCAEVSRDLSAELDVADLIEHAYTLEVSSPGLDRPLKGPGDFRRFRGRRARVKTAEPVSGRRSFDGEIVSVAEGDASVELSVDGQMFTIPLAAITRANLKVEI